MKVEIWSDIACPWCYIGKRHFEQALSKFPQRESLEVIWRSFELDPEAPARHTQPTVELLAAKYQIPLEKAQAMMNNVAQLALKVGLEYRFDRNISSNTFDAHRLTHFAATHGKRTEMVERLFRAYFTDGDAVGEHETLVRLAGEVGLDASAVTTMLASDAFAADVRADEARARAFGITAVPFFAIDEKYGVSGAQSAAAITDALTHAMTAREAPAG